MKTTLFSILFLGGILFSIGCSQESNSNLSNTETVSQSSTETTASQGAVIVFNEDKHDFGNIIQGEKVAYAFTFKNTGTSDLVISSAQGSCGCTVPAYPHEPVKPGAEGKIDVVFDSEGKSGIVQKTVTVVTNCVPSTKLLTIAATIQEKSK